MRANPFAERATEERVKFTPSFIEFVLMKCLEAKKDPLFIFMDAGLPVGLRPVQASLEAMGKVRRLGPEYKDKVGVLEIYRQVYAFLNPKKKKEIRTFCGPFSSFDSLWQRYFRFPRKDERMRMNRGMSKAKAQRE